MKTCGGTNKQHRQRETDLNRLDALADVPALTLSDDDLDAIADRIAARIAARQHSSLVDVEEMARRLSVSTDWVRRHQHELGVIKLGASVRFDSDAVVERLRATASVSTPNRPARPRKRQRSHSTVELLPIRRG
jgi:hypothetical protein